MKQTVHLIVQFPEGEITPVQISGGLLSDDGVRRFDRVEQIVEPATLVLEVIYSSTFSFAVALSCETSTIEECIVRQYGDDLYFDSEFTATLLEKKVTANACRLAINSMLLLTEFGCKQLGPASRDHHVRCVNKLRKNMDGGASQAAADDQHG